MLGPAHITTVSTATTTYSAVSSSSYAFCNPFFRCPGHAVPQSQVLRRTCQAWCHAASFQEKFRGIQTYHCLHPRWGSNFIVASRSWRNFGHRLHSLRLGLNPPKKRVESKFPDTTTGRDLVASRLRLLNPQP